MRILAYTQNFTLTGVSVQLFRLLRKLKSRHSIHVIRLRAKDDEPLVSEYQRIGISLVSNFSPYDYDVVIINTIKGGQYIHAFYKKCPVLWWIHEPMFGADVIKHGFIDPHAFELADRVVFPTLWQATKVYRQYLRRDNWTVVPMGIEIHESALPCPFDKEESGFYLMHLGTICPRKGQDLSAKAIERLGREDVVLLCVGNEQFSPDFTQWLRTRRARIVLTGVQSEEKVRAYLQHCDAMVFPTRDDLVTLAILEALSFEKCILASDFGPIPETIRHGRTGLLSPVGDHRVLAGNVRMIYEDRELLRDLGRKGRELVEQKYQFDQFVSRMEQELETIVESHGSLRGRSSQA